MSASLSPAFTSVIQNTRFATTITVTDLDTWRYMDPMDPFDIQLRGGDIEIEPDLDSGSESTVIQTTSGDWPGQGKWDFTLSHVTGTAVSPPQTYVDSYTIKDKATFGQVLKDNNIVLTQQVEVKVQ